MPLHPQAVEFFKVAAGWPPLHTLSPEAAREMLDSGAAIGAGPAVAVVRDVSIPVRDGEIAARVYAPENPEALIVWLHGGGWVFGGLDSHDAMCRMLANAAGASVMSVGYRRAPEHRFPVALEDCWTALEWSALEWPELPLIVGGDSAGGNLAAVCAIRARDRGAPELSAQILVHPIVDHDMSTSSYDQYGEDAELLLKTADMVWFFDHYVPDVSQRDDPEVSPLREPELARVAPAIVVLDEYDPLRDEGNAYVRRLREAGVGVTLHFYKDMPHAFFQFVNIFERADEAVAQVGEDVKASFPTKAR